MTPEERYQFGAQLFAEGWNYECGMWFQPGDSSAEIRVDRLAKYGHTLERALEISGVYEP